LPEDAVSKPFRVELRVLFAEREEFWTKTGNINWVAVADALEDVHYETLRKAIAGERRPSRKLMEQVAEFAGTSPDRFLEYQLDQVRRQFDEQEVGLAEATENLRCWLAVAR
jgi:hypothetical protein